jgi:DUF971 family protein
MKHVSLGPMNDDPPEELRLKDKGSLLEIRYVGGGSFRLTAEFLRVESPSAEVKGHGPGQEVTVPGKRNVRILKLEPVGHYALRIIFDDGHSTGLYTWNYLRELGESRDSRWNGYLAELDAKGLSRG